jgi:hypothetical protein
MKERLRRDATSFATGRARIVAAGARVIHSRGRIAARASAPLGAA